MVDVKLLRCDEGENKRHTWIPIRWTDIDNHQDLAVILCTSCFNTLNLSDSLSKLNRQKDDISEQPLSE